MVPLIIEQSSSSGVRPIFEADPEKSYWWGARVECASALSRLERDGLGQDRVEAAFDSMKEILTSGNEVQASDALRTTAMRLLRVHPLRAADALQLAAAIHASENHPTTMDFVCTDAKLALAASKEGFRVLP